MTITDRGASATARGAAGLAILRVRKRHKTTAVFLHEVAHTLGVIAMKLGLSWDEAKAQCKRLMQLTTAASAAPKR